MEKSLFCTFIFVLVCWCSYVTCAPKVGNPTGDDIVRNTLGARVGQILGPWQNLTVNLISKAYFFPSDVVKNYPIVDPQDYPVLWVAVRRATRIPNYFTPVVSIDDISFGYSPFGTTATFSVLDDGEYAAVILMSDYITVAPCNEDACFVCNGDNSTCADCNGDLFGFKEYDECDVCGGNNECLDCRGLMYGGWKVDACGVCGGDNSTCVRY